MASHPLVGLAFEDEPEDPRNRLNRFYERYYDRVRRIVRLRLSARLRETIDSSEILRETFMAAVKSLKISEMREEASLINWLSRLAERQVIAEADYHGTKKRDQSPLPLDPTANEEEQKIVEECIHQLPEKDRELILLRNYAGASWETVAEETGCPSAAAARMMHARAMIELGKLIREKGAG